jgi:hypothetical protein
LDLEGSREWVSPSSRGLWGGDALLLSTSPPALLEPETQPLHSNSNPRGRVGFARRRTWVRVSGSNPLPNPSLTPTPTLTRGLAGEGPAAVAAGGGARRAPTHARERIYEAGGDELTATANEGRRAAGGGGTAAAARGGGSCAAGRGRHGHGAGEEMAEPATEQGCESEEWGFSGGKSSRGRFATPADFPPQECSAY